MRYLITYHRHLHWCWKHVNERLQGRRMGVFHHRTTGRLGLSNQEQITRTYPPKKLNIAVSLTVLFQRGHYYALTDLMAWNNSCSWSADSSTSYKPRILSKHGRYSGVIGDAPFFNGRGSWWRWRDGRLSRGSTQNPRTESSEYFTSS